MASARLETVTDVPAYPSHDPDAAVLSSSNDAALMSETLEDIKHAAEGGNALAQNLIGMRYFQGNGVAQSHAKAVEWFRRSADQGHVAGQFNLGTMYLQGTGVSQSSDRAYEWIRKSEIGRSRICPRAEQAWQYVPPWRPCCAIVQEGGGVVPQVGRSRAYRWPAQPCHGVPPGYRRAAVVREGVRVDPEIGRTRIFSCSE